jgi:hypothetical protein
VANASTAAIAAAIVARDVIGPPEVLKQIGTELEQLPAPTAKQPIVGTVNAVSPARAQGIHFHPTSSPENAVRVTLPLVKQSAVTNG